MNRFSIVRPGLAACAALALAACASEEPVYEADAVDESGGDLIVEDADAPGVDVTLPETEMTDVPVDAGTDAAETPGTAPAE